MDSESANHLQLTKAGTFSSSWSTALLSDVGTVQTGPFGTQLHQEDYVDDVGTPIVTVEHLIDGRIQGEGAPLVSDSDRDRLHKYWLQSGDLVFSRVGSVDRSAQVAQHQDGWLFSGRCLRVRPKAESIEPGYLAYYFRHPPVLDYIRRIAVGATMPSINTSILSEVPVAFPARSEQRRIAWILGTLDDKIELNRQMARTLEKVSSAIFKARFVDFEGVEDFEGSEIGPVPKGWSAGKVSDLCVKTGNGGTPKRMEDRYWDNADIPWFTTGELRDVSLPSNSKEAISTAGLEESSCKLFPAGSVLIAIYAAPTVGRLGILSSEAAFNQACTALEPKVEIGTEFLFFTLKALRNHFNSTSSGSAQQNISKAIVEEAPCVIPPKGELDRVRADLKATMNASQALSKEIQLLKSIRDELLPRLISGRTRVPEEIGPDSDCDEVVAGLVEA